MIKAMLKPFFKKFIGLFISMSFVSLLAIALLCTFGSSLFTLKTQYESYLTDYGNFDEQIALTISSRDSVADVLSQVEGVDSYNARFTLDTFMKKEDSSRTIVARLFTFDEDNTIFKRYVVKHVEPSTDADVINVSFVQKFATNNNIKVGQTVELGYFGFYIKFYVNEIIETTEGIYPRANDYIWSDNQDFGYVYGKSTELDKAIHLLALKLKEDPQFREMFEEIAAELEMSVDELIDALPTDMASTFCNQILVKNKKGYRTADVIEAIQAKFEENYTTVSSATPANQLAYRLYMDNVFKQLTVASIFLPVFFYAVTMIVIGLFMNQIIKTMTPQIGVMMSIGIDKKQIVGLFMVFGLLMAIAAGILGAFVGYGMNTIMIKIMIAAYSMPMLDAAINPALTAGAIIGLMIFAELATFLSCLAIFKITPKDAVISNESKRKNLPKWLSKVVDKSPMNIKLGINSIAQNPRRFFVSTFSMFASMVLILLSAFFFVSKNEMVNQAVERRLNFDCQVYLTERITDEKLQDIKQQESVKQVEDCLYTYLQVKTSSGKSTYVETLAVNMYASDLVQIPTITGYGNLKVKEHGVILPKSIADKLGVGKGSNVTINSITLEVTDISNQYFHPMTYMSKIQMDELNALKVVSSLLVNVNDQDAFLTYMSTNHTQSLTVFTSSLSKDLKSIFNAIDVFIYIMIGFSLGMSFIILSIMSQNALIEQQRSLSVMRAIGFTVFDISNFWTLQSVLQLVLSSIIGVPAGIGFSVILFNLTSSASQTYPFIFSWGVVGIALGFVFLVVLACHLISMFNIRRWILADNLRCRE